MSRSYWNPSGDIIVNEQPRERLRRVTFQLSDEAGGTELATMTFPGDITDDEAVAAASAEFELPASLITITDDEEALGDFISLCDYE